ncbi:class I SAM-dependent methyltransferase [Aeromicrobium fastidiosum]|uniref:Class I SAM-dependent methyltransferase n=1 Tax=Aeromicrobium fastidiosum TaxID=52699 RepID=A0A641AMS2_9ACTN|nr:class I SAM-dependent methyltransferase [Aeromicrobium fastidiosum]KAA1378578.1 class I SAM-dependent methyltransferase [Aeromicrobium fastidiosum]MBP2392447.1 SAM-dependent methyltransferase [Aeromicrobium fastidiosum]
MPHDHAHHTQPTYLAEMLDLDAEIFAAALQGVYADIEGLADGPVRSIADLGAGTGTGTFGLLGHFGDAHAVAVDASDEMLAHLRRRAEQMGLSGRVTTLSADLDASVPDVDAVDLAWASASLHHLADPDRTLAALVPTIRPGGLLTVMELDGFPRFVPDGTPGGAAEARAHQLLAADRAHDMPAMGSDWGARLTTAGLIVEQHRAVTVDLTSPVPEAARRLAVLGLARIRGAVVDRLAAGELRAYDALLDGGADDVRHRPDLRVSAERQLWIARRPA